ncbi:MAG TPA: patatin-like phospholipase family protein [Pseudobdellovibrionaceae bacterium]|jgi:NTE family protein
MTISTFKDTRQRRKGLVLTGGGARAAYQVGVLRGISDIIRVKTNPFQIISGFSAGAINGTWIASRHEEFEQATRNLWEGWASLTTEQIFKTAPLPLMNIGLRWIKDRSKGGMGKKQQITYLLDTAPLNHFVRSKINFDALNSYLRAEKIHGVSVTAANYHTGHSTTFFSGSAQIQDWQSLNRISRRSDLAAHHVMASAAIPVFFPPVRINDAFYGDGMIRLNAPLSAAIRMGAESLLVIGIRGPSSTTPANPQTKETISLSEIASAILNGLFFDSLDADLARIARINRTLSVMTPSELQREPDHLRNIPVLSLRPSEEVGNMPACALSSIPFTLRFLLEGIGLTEEKSKDLLSYLSFEPRYMRSLLELGYEDTLQRKDQILEFFSEPEHPEQKLPEQERPLNT